VGRGDLYPNLSPDRQASQPGTTCGWNLAARINLKQLCINLILCKIVAQTGNYFYFLTGAIMKKNGKLFYFRHTLPPPHIH
jgi:hypothetical protein